MLNLLAVIISFLMLFIFISGVMFMKNKNPFHYKLLLIIMLLLCIYEICYCCQLITMDSEIGILFFYLKKTCLPAVGSAVLIFTIAGANYMKLFKRTLIPLGIVKLTLVICTISQLFYDKGQYVQNLGWKYEYYFRYSPIFFIVAVHLGICCTLSILIFHIASNKKRNKFGMNQYSVILYLCLPSLLYLAFFASTPLNFDLVAINMFLVIIYIYYIVAKNNGFILLPIFKSSVFELLNEGILIVDQNLRIKDYNTTLSNIFKDIDFSESLSLKVSDVFKNHPSILYTLNTLKPETIEVNKEFYTIDAHVTYNTKSSLLYTLVFKDSTNYIKSLKNLNSVTTIDYLTQLRNKQIFIDIASLEVGKANRYDIPFTLLFLDIDDFSNINDNYGHIVGDAVIVQVSNIINREIRKTDLLARYEGDTFLLLLTNTDIKFGILVAERIRKKIEESKFTFEEKNLSVTINIGVVKSENSSDKTINDYMDNAIQRTKIAKAKGKNCIISEN